MRQLSELTVRGSTGQPKAHPLLEEVRRHRVLLERLTSALCLPDESEEVGLRPGQKHGRRAINARWKNHVPNGKLADGLRGGALMATHRRPPLTVMPPPDSFFDPDKWPAGEWWQSCELWGRARMEFVKAHRFASWDLRWMCCVSSAVCMRRVGVLSGRPA